MLIFKMDMRMGLDDMSSDLNMFIRKNSVFLVFLRLFKLFFFEFIMVDFYGVFEN